MLNKFICKGNLHDSLFSNQTKMINPDSVYIFNPAYGLQNDWTKIYMFDNPNINRWEMDIESDFTNIIHPIHALIFSVFDGINNSKKCINKLSKLFTLPYEKIDQLIEPFINNKTGIINTLSGIQYKIPKNVIVENVSGHKRKYKPEDFIVENSNLEIKFERHHYPLNIIFVTNFSCVTDCIYCYANRKAQYTPMTIKRIVEIIKEASYLNIRSFDLTGGEVFLYKHWKLLLKTLAQYGYKPIISTKIPISLSIIKELKNMGYDQLQISFDTLDSQKLCLSLNVASDYNKKMLETIQNLESEGINVKIHSIITNFNSDLNNIKAFIEKLNEFKNIRLLTFTVAERSHFKDEIVYFKYRVKDEILVEIKDYIEAQKSKKLNFELRFSRYRTKEDYFCTDTSKFNERARCSANVDSCIILPDGKVTICEELYWHPKFLIGDLTKQSLTEMWNSSDALALYSLNPEVISNNSRCKECADLTNCHQEKGVCWKLILQAYGDQNWDYPDPRCPKSPKEMNVFYTE